MAGLEKRLYPVFLDLANRLALVVGESPAADKRARQLVKYGADVVVIVPDPSTWLIQAEADGLLSIERRSYERGDLAGAAVVVCVSDDDALRTSVASEAESLACPVNIADEPERSTFVFPSVTHRGSLQVAISTAGLAPGLAKKARDRIEAELGEEWAAWVTLFAQVRTLARQSVEDPAELARILAGVADDAILERLADGEALDAHSLLEELRAQEPASSDTEGASAFEDADEGERS